jgi:dihydrodiol dehydrogenase / D-xylose 1-dehydrogenase (NADP)
MSSPASTAIPIRWGFLGCGHITQDFTTAMMPLVADHKTAVLQACAARSLSSAQDFAKAHGMVSAYGSYEELCKDPAVDVVYVGTWHTTHTEHAQLALAHGKHVLVEKPMAMNAREAAATIALAREKKLFFLEGVWTRFFPAVRHVRALLEQSAIGEVQYVNADIGMVFDVDAGGNWKRSMGASTLLGLGIYPLSFVTMALGWQPEKVSAVGKLSEIEKVDVYANVTLEFGGNTFATIQYSSLTQTRETATILGSKGSIVIDSSAHTPSRVVLTKFTDNGQEESVSLFPLPEIRAGATYNYGCSEGLLYEAEAVTNAVLNKQTEVSEYPADEALGIEKIMDEVRRQLGVVFDTDI